MNLEAFVVIILQVFLATRRAVLEMGNIHGCFTEKYTTCKIHTKLNPGSEWRVFKSSPVS